MTLSGRRAQYQQRLRAGGSTPKHARIAALRAFPSNPVTRGPMGPCFICKSLSVRCGHRERELVEFYLYATREEKAILRAGRLSEVVSQPERPPKRLEAPSVGFEDAWKKRW